MGAVFRDADANPKVLVDKRITVLGYGSQGQAQAQNLRDSGFTVQVAVRPGRSWNSAVADGFEPVSIEHGAAAGILVFCISDTEIGQVFRSIEGQLQAGTALIFAHGFAVQYGLVEMLPGIDVILVAPMGAGPIVRSRYVAGSGVPALLAVQRDATGTAWELAKAYGAALGCGRAAMLETTFEEETVSDLFGEQAVLCGGLPELMMKSYRTLVQGGIQPEIAYIACVHEVKLIVDLIYERGLDGMVQRISQTAEWGAYQTSGSLVDESKLVEALRKIQSGEFAQKWIEESQAGGAELKERRAEFLRDSIHEIGGRVRKLMDIGPSQN